MFFLASYAKKSIIGISAAWLAEEPYRRNQVEGYGFSRAKLIKKMISIHEKSDR